jgi:acyl-CoA synthetase (AMP-forming)/AMP-acid ligase II
MPRTLRRNFIQRFKENVNKHPQQPLYVFLDIHGSVKASYTYEQFDERSKALACSLIRKENLNAGDRVLLAYPPGLEMMVAFFACVRAGIIPVPVYPPTTQGFSAAFEKMTYIATDCQAAAVLTDRTLYWSMRVNLTKTRLLNLGCGKNLGLLPRTAYRWIPIRGKINPGTSFFYNIPVDQPTTQKEL